MEIFVALSVLVGACIAAFLLVAWQRGRLYPLAGTRLRRVIEGGVLVGVQLVLGIVLAAIDWREVLIMGIRSSDDLRKYWAIVILAFVATTLQTFVHLHADHAETEKKAAEKCVASAQAELKQSRDERDFFVLLLKTITRVVSLKRERVSQAEPGTVALALRPEDQIVALVAAAWEIVDSLINEARARDYRVRVAYFQKTRDGLELAHCYNGTQTDCVNFAEGHLSRFKFADSQGCLATASASRAQDYLVPDTDAADRDQHHPFTFFHPAERKSLKSIAALAVRVEGGPAPCNVLVIDTDRSGFFNEESVWLGERLRAIVSNLAHRLHLEECLLERKGEQG
jgi:hypothetical protein